MKQPDIIKIAALSMDAAGRLLIVKPVNKPVWISLGGKLEEGETEEKCLLREIKEEIGVSATSKPVYYCETPIEIAANTKDTTVIVKFYLVDVPAEFKVDGEELEEHKWISAKDYNSIKKGKFIQIGSGLEHYAIPKLIKDGILK